MGFLSRTVEPTRRRLEQRAGLPAGAGDDALARSAGRLGLDEDDVAAVLRPVTSDDEAMAAGRALAHLEGRSG